MPLNARLALAHDQGGWSSMAELLMVGAKKHVSDLRNEVPTAGYALLNLRTSYEVAGLAPGSGRGQRLQPLLPASPRRRLPGSGRHHGGHGSARGVSVPGMGRSFYLGATVKF
jgi:iron complex outermembrane receptor protein